jgi:hypothetical protein
LSFSPEWDARYAEDTHLSMWPWSDLVSYCHRYAAPYSPKTKVLEIGFGAGANIPFFRTLGVAYSGIEGSRSIHERVCAKFPELAQTLYLGDFLSFRFPDTYDLIADRGSMTHNSTKGIKDGLKHLSEYLPAGGIYIGIDWYSTGHSDYLIGEVCDEFTRFNLPHGQFAGVGKVHFSDEEHILGLFSEAGFRVTRLEHKKNISIVPDDGHLFASWNLVAEKLPE